MKRVTLKRLTTLGLSVLLLFCVLSPLPCFAYTQDVEMTVGESKTFTSATYTTFTYQWTIESGSDVISIQSGTTAASCEVKAEKTGDAVLKVVYTRTGRVTRSYTDKYNITVSEPSYTVTLDANGGYVSKSKIFIKDYEIITLPTPTRSGYSFLGWFTKATNGKQIHSGKTVHITGDATLYAHWKQIEATPSPTPSPSSRPHNESRDDSDPFCPTCDGLGDCPKCYGEGYLDCSACILGKCSHCGGTGEKLSYSYGELRSRDCTYCRGSGSCSRCNGFGEIQCSRCKGDGRCPTCHGSGFKPGRSLDN